MKIERFNESKIPSCQFGLRGKCKKVFSDLWKDKLGFTKLDIGGFEQGAIVMYVSFGYKAILSDKTYNSFREVFDVLSRAKIIFSLHETHIAMSIPNLQEFITEMEVLKNSKKYNL